MKSIYFSFFFLIGIFSLYAQSLEVDESGHYLINNDGETVLLNGDTGWNLAVKLTREDAMHYLNERKEQCFNTIALAALFYNEKNVYGQEPFEKVNGHYDPTKPLIGKDINNYWNHIDFVLKEIKKRKMYAVVVISFNDWVSGDYRGNNRKEIIFNKNNAYQYARWIGERYKKFDNIIWMLGGDRSPIHNTYDYRLVYNSMAEGIADGIKGMNSHDGNADYSGILMSYHPPKFDPNSAAWFHNEPWLSLNSIQACPGEQVNLISSNYSLYPIKPTWLFEGRYEQHTFDYKSWQMRFQAYLTLLAGGLGNIYGHIKICTFTNEWKEYLHDPGAEDMKNMFLLFSKYLKNFGYNLTDLIPDQRIIANMDYGYVSSQCWISMAPTSDRNQAMISEDRKFAIVYTSNGREVILNKQSFIGYFNGAYWYNPRSGLWSVNEIEKINKEPDLKEWPENNTFDPPGIEAIDNDWILLIEQK